MKVKIDVEIEVADEEEARLIRLGLQDPATKALVKVMGALKPLNDAARARVLTDVYDKMEIAP